jgi:hypoxanthine phosphoribosyltransferase
MKTYITPLKFFCDSLQLAKVIYNSNYRPDLILTLWRGGCIPGIVIDEYFKLNDLTFKSFPISVSSYDSNNKSTNQLKFNCCNNVFSLINGINIRNVLIIDDIFDTGNTAYHVINKVKENGGVSKFASVYYKKDKCTLDIKPDYYIETFEKDEWIVFPHEKDGKFL